MSNVISIFSGKKHNDEETEAHDVSKTIEKNMKNKERMERERQEKNKKMIQSLRMKKR